MRVLHSCGIPKKPREPPAYPEGGCSTVVTEATDPNSLSS